MRFNNKAVLHKELEDKVVGLKITAGIETA